MSLYPLKFIPRLIPKMWGGRKLGEILGKHLPPGKPIGESWEIFDFPPGTTGPDALTPADEPNGWISATIANGPLAGRTLHDLMLDRAVDLLGAAQPVQTPAGPQFPLLIKFLDARDDLSVQVHPPPSYAAIHPNAFVKNEAWHILHAEAGSRILLGAKPGVTAERFRAALADGTADQLSVPVPVSIGETYYMPSGTLHALGGGIVAYEVQTPSDTTYRVYDFNRIDPATGRPRALHVEQAMACIGWDFDALRGRTPPQHGNALLAQAPQWVLSQVIVPAGATHDILNPDAPIIMTCIAGSGEIRHATAVEPYAPGQTLLLPPSARTRVTAERDTKMLLAGTPEAAGD